MRDFCFHTWSSLQAVYILQAKHVSWAESVATPGQEVPRLARAAKPTLEGMLFLLYRNADLHCMMGAAPMFVSHDYT